MRFASLITIFSDVVTTRRLTVSLSSKSLCRFFMRSINDSISSNTLSFGIGTFIVLSIIFPIVLVAARSIDRILFINSDRRSGYFSRDSVSPVGAQSTMTVS